MSKLLKRIFALVFVAVFGCCLLIGCSTTNEPGGETGGDDPGGNTGGTDEDPPGVYSYGENWADTYDAAYTQSLLDMGEQGFTLSQIGGTDGAGRSFSAHGTKKESSRYVGVFYFLWLTDFGGIYDISKIQEENAALATDTIRNPLWALPGSEYYDASVSPLYAFHYFEEPLYGYYQSDDPWVIRRHLELLAMADIDFLYLDFTNAGLSGSSVVNIYQKQTYALLDAILELQSKGYDVPQIVPMVCNPSTGGGTQSITKIVEWVYENYYAHDDFKYKSCWFTADKTRNPSGKPLLVCYDFDEKYLTNSAAAGAFWMRKVVWPTSVSQSDFENGFPWMDYSLPQNNYGGIMNVSVAQHLTGSWSSEAYLARSRMNASYQYRGRSATSSQKYAYETDSVEQAVYGQNFADEWYNVLRYEGDDEVWMVTVTGWNEWVAQKYNHNGANSYANFVDTFNIAFSRDIEMMRDGGYSDNFFMQLAQNVRDFKYAATGKNSSAAMWMRQSVDWANVSAWDNVSAKYIDITADAQTRNYSSVANVYTYTDDSARNDISYLKIANDSEYLYVLVAAEDKISEYTAGDDCWMNLYLSTGKAGGWENYNFVINRSPSGNKTSIEALSVGADGKIVATALSAQADYAVNGQYISYRIPLEALGVTSADEIQIKACDNIFGVKATDENDGVGVYSFGDAMAFYCGGDSAPIGRLNYVYRMAY